MEQLSPVYFPTPPSDRASLDAKHGLADDVRGLIEAVASVDAATSSPESIETARRAVEVAREAVAALGTTPPDTGPATPAGSFAERSPFTGLGNPLAAPMRVAVTGDMTTGWAVYGQAFQGAVGDVHGGVLAGTFDDLLGCAQLVSPVSGRTGTLTIRYRSPSPIGRRIDFSAHVERVEGRKVYCVGTAHCDGTLLAEADAVYIAPRPS